MVSDTWLDAQVGVLGSVLIDPDLAPRLLIDVGAADFSGDCRAVYGAISALVAAAEPVDALTVRNKLGAASAQLIAELMTRTPTSANYAAYVAACKEQSRLRTLHTLAMELAATATLDEARSTLSRMQGVTVEHNAHRVTSLTDALVAFTQRRNQERHFIPFGLPALDDKVFVSPGDVVVLGGYPSDGKSALALQLALEMAKTHKIGFFSFEGTQQKTVDRIVAHGAKLRLGAIRRSVLSDAEWMTAIRQAGELSKLRLDIIEASGMGVEDVIGMTLSRGYDVIFLDYIQLIKTQQRRGGTRQEELAEISKALAVACRQHKLLVVEISQLTRPERKKDGSYPPPTMSSLRESGQLEQDADVVMLLYRTQTGAQGSPRELYVAKNKEGELGRIALHFDGATQTFYRTTYEEIDRYAAKGKKEARRKVAGQYILDGLDDPTPDNPFVGGGV